MYIVTFVGFFLLGIYLTNVLRLTKEDSDEALRLTWYYPFTPSYWCPDKSATSSERRILKELKVHPVNFKDSTPNLPEDRASSSERLHRKKTDRPVSAINNLN
jgi:hypothetical protein